MPRTRIAPDDNSKKREASGDRYRGRIAQAQFKPGSQLKVTFEIPQPLPPPVPAADAAPGETAQRARTGILVRTVSLRANAGPETSHG